MLKCSPLRLCALLFLVVSALGSGACLGPEGAGTGRSGRNSPGLHLPPGETFRFNMGDKQLSLPGPQGGVIKAVQDPVRQAAGAWLLPPENIFCVYENPGTFKLRGDKAAGPQSGIAILRQRTVIIISALPEFMDESVSSGQLKALRADLIRTSGLWRDSAPDEFLRMTTNYYKERPGFTHSLGVYHRTAYSTSDARIVKETDPTAVRKPGGIPSGTNGTDTAQSPAQVWASMGSRNDREATGAVSGSGGTVLGGSGTTGLPRAALSAELRRYFASGHYTLSIRNLMAMRGKVFNIYFNTPLQSLEDIDLALEENARYMEQIAKQADSGEGPLSGLSGERPAREPERSGPRPEDPIYVLSDPIA